MTIDLPNHVGTALKLHVTTNLDSSATDESWGIAGVKIGPIHGRWHNTEVFAVGVTHDWQGSEVQNCGLVGAVLGGPAKAVAGTKLRKSKVVAD